MNEDRNAAALARAAGRREKRPRFVSANPRSISPKARAWVMERDGFRCRRCGAGRDHGMLVIDHIVPVASGGTGELDNLQTLCEACNAGKGARPPHAHDLRTPAGIGAQSRQPHPDKCERCNRSCYALSVVEAGRAGFSAAYGCSCGYAWVCYWRWGAEVDLPDPNPWPGAGPSRFAGPQPFGQRLYE